MKVISIIVSYNPELENLYDLINRLDCSCYKILLVDNNSKNKNSLNLLNSISSKLNIIFLEQNLGIAEAQNRAIQSIFDNNYDVDYICFFDQDSLIERNFIEDMIVEYSNLRQLDSKIGIIGPALYNEEKKIFYPISNLNKSGFISSINYSLEDKLPIRSNLIISSGSFVSYEVLNKVGKMKSELFIDDVDTEFCLRTESLGFNNYIVPNVIMKHFIGDDTISFLGKIIVIHSPLRRYYMLRNIIILSKYSYFPLLYIIKRLLNFVFSTILIIILSKNGKLDYIKKFFKSIIDGLKYHIYL